MNPLKQWWQVKELEMVLGPEALDKLRAHAEARAAAKAEAAAAKKAMVAMPPAPTERAAEGESHAETTAPAAPRAKKPRKRSRK